MAGLQVTPVIGQGCNSALEDCEVLDSVLEATGTACLHAVCMSQMLHPSGCVPLGFTPGSLMHMKAHIRLQVADNAAYSECMSPNSRSPVKPISRSQAAAGLQETTLRLQQRHGHAGGSRMLCHCQQ